MKQPIFVTGNIDKVDFLDRVLSIKLLHLKLSLDEIQASSSTIVAEHKARQAYAVVKKPVLIEDSYLSFTALQGMPGPFVKFFFEANHGLEPLCRMLDGFKDRSAAMGAVYCYYNGVEIRTFDVKITGSIARHSRGEHGYGWDKIFELAGHDGLTLAELPLAQALAPYREAGGFQALQAFLKQ